MRPDPFARRLPRAGLTPQRGLPQVMSARSSGGAQGFEDAMRDLRFKPLLQLGLAYSY